MLLGIIEKELNLACLTSGGACWQGLGCEHYRGVSMSFYSQHGGWWFSVYAPCECLFLSYVLPCMLVNTSQPSNTPELSVLTVCLTGLPNYSVLLLSLRASCVKPTKCFLSFFPEFFGDLDAASDELSLTSSLIRLVHYVRQGLHWLRLETKMP